MQTKKLTVCTYNINIGSKIIKKFNSIKGRTLLTGLFIFLFLTFSFAFILNFYKVYSCANNNRDIYIADFKSDINNLSETAAIIEAERKLNESSQINSFGSDGEIMSLDELKPDLKNALINIADTNNDGTLSTKEVSELKIMKLRRDVYQKELNVLHFSLRSGDCNLKNYVVITQGKYAGTILYNGPLKYIDNDNNRYFGLELYS